MKALPLMIAALAATSLCAPAFAADLPSRPVDFHPDELSTADGRTAIEQRLETAARQVCREHGMPGAALRSSEAQCREDALQGALASLYDNRSVAQNTARNDAGVPLASNSR